MNLALFAHTWRSNRTRALIVAIALAVWGTFLPIIYDSFGSAFKDIFASGALPPQFAQFGGGDIFSLSGSVAIGFIHPIAVGTLRLVISACTVTAPAMRICRPPTRSAWTSSSAGDSGNWSKLAL